MRWTEEYQPLNDLMGKRVRYVEEGSGPTMEVRTDPEHLGEAITAPYRMVVEGTAAGWQVGPHWEVEIAGYGRVNFHQCEVIED